MGFQSDSPSYNELFHSLHVYCHNPLHFHGCCLPVITARWIQILENLAMNRPCCGDAFRRLVTNFLSWISVAWPSSMRCWTVCFAVVSESYKFASAVKVPMALSIVCMAEDFLFHGLSKKLTESTVAINEGHVVSGPKLVVVGHLNKLASILCALT